MLGLYRDKAGSNYRLGILHGQSCPSLHDTPFFNKVTETFRKDIKCCVTVFACDFFYSFLCDREIDSKMCSPLRNDVGYYTSDIGA